MELRTIRRALLSVSDKTGLIELARVLASFGVTLISTGGTGKAPRPRNPMGDFACTTSVESPPQRQDSICSHRGNPQYCQSPSRRIWSRPEALI